MVQITKKLRKFDHIDIYNFDKIDIDILTWAILIIDIAYNREKWNNATLDPEADYNDIEHQILLDIHMGTFYT